MVKTLLVIKKSLFLIVFIFTFSIKSFSEEKQLEISFGQNGGCGFSEKTSIFASWKYNYSNKFLKIVGGSQFSSGICDNTILVDVFKDFFPGVFQIQLSGGLIYHAGIMIKDALIQDEHFIISSNFSIKEIGLSLLIFGGCGFNNTYTSGIWLNDFYPIVACRLAWDFLKRFSVFVQFSSFDFFLFEGFLRPKYALGFSTSLTEKLSATLSTVIKTTSIIAQEKIEIEHIDFKASLKYEL